jgi:hypothetical protein
MCSCQQELSWVSLTCHISVYPGSFGDIQYKTLSNQCAAEIMAEVGFLKLDHLSWCQDVTIIVLPLAPRGRICVIKLNLNLRLYSSLTPIIILGRLSMWWRPCREGCNTGYRAFPLIQSSGGQGSQVSLVMPPILAGLSSSITRLTWLPVVCLG